MSRPKPQTPDDDDYPIGPDDVVKAKLTLRRWRLVRTGFLILGGAAGVVVVANKVAAGVEHREVDASTRALIARIEAWAVDPSSTLAGARVHRGARANVIEGPEMVFLVVDGKVVAEAPR
ncbi:MAG: hypothetical protein Q8O67_07965 [Deltaproteobacteria bacterium]|nr:hypothetical protein [Deltaproteobacteria bacterium]